MLAVALAVSIASLVVGLVISARATRAPRGLVVLDAVTLALVPGVALTRLLPHLVEDGGAAPLIGLAAGYLGFQLLEARAHRRASRLGVALVVPALALHAWFDGATLGLVLGGRPLGDEGVALVLAILLHRVPEGLFVGSAMAGSRSSSTWVVVAALAAFTVTGALAGGALVDAVPHDVAHVGVAVGLGIMVRMVVDRHGPALAADRGDQLAGGLAFVACLVLLAAIPNPHDLLGTARAHELSVREALVPLFLETAPVLLAVLALSELVAARTRSAAPPREGPDAVASATLLYALLLGPCVAALRAAIAPLAAWLRRGRIPAPAWWLPRARDVLPSYAIGVVIAAALEAALPSRSLADAPALAAIAGAAAAGVALPIGGGAPVLAAVLAHKGAPLPAVLALVAGSAARASAAGGRARVLAAIAAGALATLLAPLLARCTLRALHAVGAHPHAPHEWLAASALAAWIAVDLARAGPRAWLRSSP